jgi:DNA-binding GntR family transcriptional regulator
MLRGEDWSRASASVAEQIAVRIAGLITLDLIHTGQRLLENDISQVLHVSRAPVREALRILERERLVEFEPRRGAIVTAPDARDLRDIYVVREALYVIMMKILMEECPDKLDAVFARHLPKIRKAVEDSTDAYAIASFLLNLDIFDLCSNRLLAETLTSISLRTLRYARLGLAAEPAVLPGKVKTWSALQRAVAKRDMDHVLETLKRRIESSRDAAVRALEPPPLNGRSESPRAPSPPRRLSARL